MPWAAHKRILLPLSLLLVGAPSAWADEEPSQLDLLLQGGRYDPDLLIRESTGEEGDGPFTSRPGDRSEIRSHDRVAMVIPRKRGGLIGNAARALERGFQHAAEADGGRVELVIYATDGTPESVLSSYDHAVAKGVGLIIGPMLKSNVAALLERSRDIRIPTLVTQPVDVFGFDRSEIYGISIGNEAEAGLVARTVAPEARVAGAVVVQAPGTLGLRVAAGFADEWRRVTGRVPRRVVVATEEDLVDLHLEMRAVAKESVEGGGIRPVVFIAGDREFVLKVRAHIPGLVRLHGLSLINEGLAVTGGEDVSMLGLNNVRIVEMPWIATPQAELPAHYASEAARDLPYLEQRFFALGIDCYRLSLQAVCWRAGCGAEGVSGAWSIPEGSHNFVRTGVVSDFANGVLEIPDS